MNDSIFEDIPGPCAVELFIRGKKVPAKILEQTVTNGITQYLIEYETYQIVNAGNLNDNRSPAKVKKTRGRFSILLPQTI